MALTSQLACFSDREAHLTTQALQEEIILNYNLKNKDPGRLVANKSDRFLILQNIVKDIDESKKYAMVFN